MKKHTLKKGDSLGKKMFDAMNYEELANIFSMHSPHLLPIMRKVNGYLNPKVTVCSLHQTPLIVIEGEEQGCLLCSQENFEKSISKKKNSVEK